MWRRTRFVDCLLATTRLAGTARASRVGSTRSREQPSPSIVEESIYGFVARLWRQPGLARFDCEERAQHVGGVAFDVERLIHGSLRLHALTGKPIRVRVDVTPRTYVRVMRQRRIRPREAFPRSWDVIRSSYSESGRTRRNGCRITRLARTRSRSAHSARATEERSATSMATVPTPSQSSPTAYASARSSRSFITTRNVSSAFST